MPTPAPPQTRRHVREEVAGGPDVPGGVQHVARRWHQEGSCVLGPHLPDHQHADEDRHAEKPAPLPPGRTPQRHATRSSPAQNTTRR
jgi:hypothetical protein